MTRVEVRGVELDGDVAGSGRTLVWGHGVIARTEAGAVVCDLRSVDPGDDGTVAAALAAT